MGLGGMCVCSVLVRSLKLSNLSIPARNWIGVQENFSQLKKLKGRIFSALKTWILLFSRPLATHVYSLSSEYGWVMFCKQMESFYLLIEDPMNKRQKKIEKGFLSVFYVFEFWMK